MDASEMSRAAWVSQFRLHGCKSVFVGPTHVPRQGTQTPRLPSEAILLHIKFQQLQATKKLKGYSPQWLFTVSAWPQNLGCILWKTSKQKPLVWRLWQALWLHSVVCFRKLACLNGKYYHKSQITLHITGTHWALCNTTHYVSNQLCFGLAQQSPPS